MNDGENTYFCILIKIIYYLYAINYNADNLCWSEYIDSIVNNFKIGWKKLSKYTLFLIYTYLIFLNMYPLFGMAAPHMILRALKRYNYMCH